MARCADATIHPLALPMLALAAPPSPGTPDPKLVERARAILQRAPLVDTHNDLPYALLEKTGGDLTKVDLGKRQPELPADIPRLREGRVGAQYWSSRSGRTLTRRPPAPWPTWRR